MHTECAVRRAEHDDEAHASGRGVRVVERERAGHEAANGVAHQHHRHQRGRYLLARGGRSGVSIESENVLESGAREGHLLEEETAVET